MKNAAQLWQDACREEIGINSDGDVASKLTRLGSVASVFALPTYRWELATSRTLGDLLADTSNQRAQNIAQHRIAVATFLRELAVAIEAGE